MHVSEIVTTFFPKFKFGALDIFQGVHGVREINSGQGMEIFGKSQGQLGFRQVFLKNGQIFAVWPIF